MLQGLQKSATTQGRKLGPNDKSWKERTLHILTDDTAFYSQRFQFSSNEPLKNIDF